MYLQHSILLQNRGIRTKASVGIDVDSYGLCHFQANLYAYPKDIIKRATSED